MKKAKTILKKLLYPPIWVLVVLPPISFATLIFVFANKANVSEFFACTVYFLSAYSLAILVPQGIELAKSFRKTLFNNKLMQKMYSSEFGSRYLFDLSFRGIVSIYQGMFVNFFYVIFRIFAGIRYMSLWFLSMAVYYFILGAIRAYLIYSYHHRDEETEFRCYRRTARLLLLLNLSMGVMIVIMVRTNSGFSYPGHIIYLSAAYTFYMVFLAVLNIIRFRKLGDLILTAAKILNFVAAMMSVLGLQTAMIAQFSDGNVANRMLMNGITGGCVCGIVLAIAIVMLVHCRKLQKTREKESACEQI